MRSRLRGRRLMRGGNEPRFLVRSYIPSWVVFDRKPIERHGRSLAAAPSPRCRRGSRSPPRSAISARARRAPGRAWWWSSPGTTRRLRLHPRPYGQRVVRRAGELGSRFAEVARDHDVSPHQACLAWMPAKAPAVIPIPGSSRPETILASAKAADLELSPDELARLDATS
ncbi:MAG: aldo/keto reductase [Thermobispora bispora]|nr:aldo/keto reductase [Thermobispora bispora]